MTKKMGGLNKIDSRPSSDPRSLLRMPHDSESVVVSVCNVGVAQRVSVWVVHEWSTL